MKFDQVFPKENLLLVKMKEKNLALRMQAIGSKQLSNKTVCSRA